MMMGSAAWTWRWKRLFVPLLPPRVRVLILMTLYVIVVSSSSMVLRAEGGSPPAMKKVMVLERSSYFPKPEEKVDHHVLQALRSRDRARHGRLLQRRINVGAPSTPGVVDFLVHGSFDPFTVGLYYTRVKLGNPPKEFYVQIDTGSDVLWVACRPCNGCPTSSGLPIQVESFDPQESSTASLLSCSDQRCNSIQSSEGTCTLATSGTPSCGYTFQYGDGSGTSGYYVQDAMYLDAVLANGLTINLSANVVFGCSNLQSGDLTKVDRAVDGIFGFGQHDLSIISQLSSLGVAPKVFSHCLKGSGDGGGILVLGEMVEPGIAYTPLVQSLPHYNLNLQSIAVNGQILPIDSAAFATSSTQGTIIDSGTTLAYLAEQAYDPFINAVTSLISQSVQSIDSKGSQCFSTTNRVEDVFPFVTLNFAGGASMNLRPQDYLLQQGSVDNAIIWCIGWQKNQGEGITILGDLVLKDKIFVYDLAGQRIGWVNYDCSQSVNVSSSTGKSEFLNTGQYNYRGSSERTAFFAVTLFAVGFVVHIFVLILHL